MKKQQICILGSTGSIGTQALDVIEQHPDRYEAYCLTANNRVDELAAQARKFNPAAVVIANEAHYDRLKELLADMPDIKVYAGADALCQIVEAGPIDMVLTAMVGFSGLAPTIHAIKRVRRSVLPTRRRWWWLASWCAVWQQRTVCLSCLLTVNTRQYSRASWARVTTR